NGFHADPRSEAPSHAAGQKPAAAQPSPLDATSRILASQQARAWMEAGLGGRAPEAPVQASPVRPEPAPAAPRPEPEAAPTAAPTPANADMFRAAPAARVQHQQLRDML